MTTAEQEPAFEALPPEERLFRMRHSAAHVLAEAVLEAFPEAKYAIVHVLSRRSKVEGRKSGSAVTFDFRLSTFD